MALKTDDLEKDIIALLDDMEASNKVEGATPEDIKKKYAKGLAEAMEKWIKTGAVEKGIQLAAGPYTGATTGEGKIS